MDRGPVPSTNIFNAAWFTTVSYAGQAEWSYRRFILHMARICELAAGVGLIRGRDGATSHPFVASLIDLAGRGSNDAAAARIGCAADLDCPTIILIPPRMPSTAIMIGGR